MPQVNNPYTFNIKNDYKTYVVINAAVPDIETVLYETSSDQAQFNITIPSGVTVLKVEGSVEDYNEDADTSLRLNNRSNNKSWLDENDLWGCFGREYIGVTPNKTYSLSWNTNGDELIDTTLGISYSKSINNQNPTVTDY